MNEKKSEFLTIKQVSVKVDLTHTSIYSQIKRGIFPAGEKIGSYRVWTVEEIDNWIKERNARNAKKAIKTEAEKAPAMLQ